jgi:hypothetical protein
MFSVPGLMGLYTASLAAVAYRHGARRCLQAAVASLALGGGLFLALDRLVFVSPQGYSGIASYVWTAGVYHTRVLSDHGPSIWNFLGRDPLSSSDQPFYGDLTPKQAGYTAFGLLFAFTGLALGLHGLRVLSSRTRFLAGRRMLCLQLLCFVGLTNWLMGTLLVGTHERHMVHTFPFLLLGLAGLRQTEAGPKVRRWIAVVALAAFVYGCFVYSVICEDVFRLLFVLRSQAFVAAFLLTAFAFVYVGFQRHVLQSLRRRGPQLHEPPQAAEPDRAAQPGGAGRRRKSRARSA